MGTLASIMSGVQEVTNLHASFPSSQIRNAVNEAYESIYNEVMARVPEAFQTTLSGSLTSGVGEYSLSASLSVANVRAIVAQDPQSKTYVRTAEDADFYAYTVSDKTRILWTLTGENILKIRPVPGSGEDGETFRIILDLAFSALSDGDSPAIVTDQPIKNEAIGILLDAVGDADADRYHTRAARQVGGLLDRLRQRYAGVPENLEVAVQDYPWAPDTS